MIAWVALLIALVGCAVFCLAAPATHPNLKRIGEMIAMSGIFVFTWFFAGSRLIKLFAIFLFVSLVATGCATAGGQALGKCELGAIPSELEPLIVAVEAVATNTASTLNDLNALLTGTVGANQLACVVAAVDAALPGAAPVGAVTLAQAARAPLSHAHAVLQGWLAAHPGVVGSCR